MLRVYLSVLILLILPVSTNAQDFWENLEGPQGVDFMNATEVNCFVKLGGDSIFACLNNGVVLSLDEGATWQRRTIGLPIDMGPYGLFAVS